MKRNGQDLDKKFQSILANMDRRMNNTIIQFNMNMDALKYSSVEKALKTPEGEKKGKDA